MKGGCKHSMMRTRVCHAQQASPVVAQGKAPWIVIKLVAIYRHVCIRRPALIDKSVDDPIELGALKCHRLPSVAAALRHNALLALKSAGSKRLGKGVRGRIIDRPAGQGRKSMQHLEVRGKWCKGCLH